MKRLEIIIIVITLILAGSIQVAHFYMNRNAGKYVNIYKDAKLYTSLKINENKTIEIKDADDINIIVVENGKVYMKDANCSDKVCVDTGIITGAGQSIICLPHKIVVEIAGERKGIDDSAY
ncbi:hypothetical protein ABG79_01478 [Caloramator mitchellensis]|uniref:Uncharacterized protein n=1 Tax=Caloramator mitchellensis TaxID=908809 RepID=A0A0R3JT77_CALMK|nr:NusG domain II-containing protein [Caloramator mitchellensis]KRQ86726.1 hypothetical protein ABG79_01478 [Caloramator mitchellensis]